MASAMVSNNVRLMDISDGEMISVKCSNKGKLVRIPMLNKK